MDWGIDYDIGYETQLQMMKSTSMQEEPKLTRGFSFILIEEKEIDNKQQKMVEYVKDTIGLSECLSRALLL